MNKEIQKLKKDLNAVIVAHNYQKPEVQDVADYVGDSLELSRLAATLDAPVIVFAGVRFMAESAKILSPQKTVLLPEKEAGCPLADMITIPQVEHLKKEHPKAAVVTYINSNIEIKAISDICCTSANALKVVESLDNDEIIFIPDRNLGHYTQKFTKKKLYFNEGYCIVHESLHLEDLKKMKAKYPEAKVIAHPECPMSILDMADSVESTSGMTRYVKESKSTEFIIATEVGMNYRLAKQFPEKKFYSIEPEMVCRNMKKTNLESVYNALRYKQYEIILEPEMIEKAKNSLQKMIDLK